MSQRADGLGHLLHVVAEPLRVVSERSLRGAELLNLGTDAGIVGDQAAAGERQRADGLVGRQRRSGKDDLEGPHGDRVHLCHEGVDVVVADDLVDDVQRRQRYDALEFVPADRCLEALEGVLAAVGQLATDAVSAWVAGGGLLSLRLTLEEGDVRCAEVVAEHRWLDVGCWYGGTGDMRRWTRSEALRRVCLSCVPGVERTLDGPLSWSRMSSWRGHATVGDCCKTTKEKESN